MPIAKKLKNLTNYFKQMQINIFKNQKIYNI